MVSLTLPLLRSKSTFSHHLLKSVSEVVRIGSIIIFPPSNYEKAEFFILCDVIFLVKLQGKLDIDRS